MASFDPYGMLSGALENTGIVNADPVGNFNFVLTVEGVYDVPLKSVRAFQKVNQYEKIREGGVNDYVHLKRAPIQDAHTIQFERYTSASLLDPLANGAELTIPLILWIKRAANNSSGDDYDSSSVRLYIFTGATVMSKEYGALDAEHSGLHTEVVTVGYKELYIVPNLISYFGGGAGNVGEMGELARTDEKARKEFEKARKDAYDKAIAANAAAKKDADDKAKKAKDDFYSKSKEEAYKKAVKDNKDKAEAAKKAETEAAKAFKDSQDEAYKEAVEEHKTQAKDAKDKAEKDKKAAEDYVKTTADEEKARLEKEEKAKKEQEQLNKANKKMQDRQAKREQRRK